MLYNNNNSASIDRSLPDSQMAGSQQMMKAGVHVSPPASWRSSPCDAGQPVAVRVLNAAPEVNHASEDVDTGSSHLSYLYDRAQQPVYQPGVHVTSPTSPTSRYPSVGRAVPAPTHQQLQQQPGSDSHSSSSPTNGVTEYNPFTRATPAPLHQHQQLTSPVRHQPAVTSQSTSSAAEQITRQLSHLGVSNGHYPSTSPQQQLQQQPKTMPNGEPMTHRGGRARQPSAISFARRQSAPGPVGQNIQPGSRKPWSYTPSFGVASSTTRNGLTSPRTGMPPTAMPNGAAVTSRVHNNDGRLSAADAKTYSRQSSLADDSSRVNGEHIDNASIRYKLREGEDALVDYDETSIRYRGRANPSKTFRLLQTATGSDSESDIQQAVATSRRQQTQRRRLSRDELDDEQQQQPPHHADDIVDISYVGASIPSRTFRCLQEAMGVATQPQQNGSDELGWNGTLGSGRNVRVIRLRPQMAKHSSSVDNILSCTNDL